MRTLARAFAVVTAVAAFASVGAATALAGSPSPPALLGANVQSKVYLDQGGELQIVNQATVSEEFRFQPSADWHVAPSSLQLVPNARATVVVTGDGQDGAPIRILVAAADPQVGPGEQQSQLALTAHVFHATPLDPWTPVKRAFPYIALAVLIAWLLWRLKPWQLRLAKRS